MTNERSKKKINQEDGSNFPRPPKLSLFTPPACKKFVDAFHEYVANNSHLPDQEMIKFTEKTRLSNLVDRRIWKEILNQLYPIVKDLSKAERDVYDYNTLAFELINNEIIDSEESDSGINIPKWKADMNLLPCEVFDDVNTTKHKFLMLSDSADDKAINNGCTKHVIENDDGRKTNILTIVNRVQPDVITKALKHKLENMTSDEWSNLIFEYIDERVPSDFEEHKKWEGNQCVIHYDVNTGKCTYGEPGWTSNKEVTLYKACSIVRNYLKTNVLEIPNILAKHYLGTKRKREHDSEKDHQRKDDESPTAEQTARRLKRKLAKKRKKNIRSAKIDKQHGNDKTGPMCHNCLKWGHRKAECSQPYNASNQAQAMEDWKKVLKKKAAAGDMKSKEILEKLNHRSTSDFKPQAYGTAPKKAYFSRRAADGTAVIYEGRPLNDRASRDEYNIPEGHTLIDNERLHQLTVGQNQPSFARRATTTTILDPKDRVWTPPIHQARRIRNLIVMKEEREIVGCVKKAYDGHHGNAKHNFLVDDNLHDDNFEAELTFSNGKSVNCRSRCIYDHGADFVIFPTHIAKSFLDAGGTLYQPSDAIIKQVSTEARVEGVVYGNLLIHVPEGIITFIDMQIVIMEGDEILLSTYVGNKLGIKPYEKMRELALLNPIMNGNHAEHLERG